MDNYTDFNSFSCEYKPWESSILDFSVYSLSFNDNLSKAQTDNLEIEFKKLETILAKNSPLMLTTRIPSTNYNLVRALEKKEYHLMECYIELKHSLNSIPKISGLSEIRPFTKKDVKIISDIAFDSFSFDRFHIDSNISNNKASQTRAQWVKNACQGRAEEVFIAKINNEIAGFVICKEKKTEEFKYCNLDLIAVSKHFRRRQVAKDLTIEFLNYSQKKGYDFALVGTQAHNIASLRLYQKAGFLVTKSLYSYHKHIKIGK